MLVKLKMQETSFFSLSIDYLRNWISSSSYLDDFELPFSVMFERLIGVEARSSRSINLIPLQRFAN
jgi:hypothetical protein